MPVPQTSQNISFEQFKKFLLDNNLTFDAGTINTRKQSTVGKMQSIISQNTHAIFIDEEKRNTNMHTDPAKRMYAMVHYEKQNGEYVPKRSPEEECYLTFQQSAQRLLNIERV